MIKRLVLVIFRNRTHLTKEGKEVKDSMYFLELTNGKRIPIQPIFSNDYPLLNIICDVEFNDSPKKDN